MLIAYSSLDYLFFSYSFSLVIFLSFVASPVNQTVMSNSWLSEKPELHLGVESQAEIDQGGIYCQAYSDCWQNLSPFHCRIDGPVFQLAVDQGDLRLMEATGNPTLCGLLQRLFTTWLLASSREAEEFLSNLRKGQLLI